MFTLNPKVMGKKRILEDKENWYFNWIDKLKFAVSTSLFRAGRQPKAEYFYPVFLTPLICPKILKAERQGMKYGLFSYT